MSAPTIGPNTLAVYLRVSSEEQRQQGTIETQRGAAERYCALYEHTPYGWYADDGVSGTVPFASRPEGARLMADAMAGHITTVLIWRLDRFGRNAYEILGALKALQALNVRLVSITEAFDTETPAGRLQINMLAAIAQFERDSIIQRSDEGTARRLARTVFMGGKAPYGYRVVGKGQHARLILSDDPIPGLALSEVDVVRLIYDLLVEHRWGCDAIAHHLNQLGIPTLWQRDGKTIYTRNKTEQPTAGIWRNSVVYQLVTKSVYQGVPIYTTRDRVTRVVTVHTGEAPAIVTPALWARAQECLNGNTRFNRKSQKHEYLLQGLMRCALCGSVYSGTSYHLGHDKTAPRSMRFYVCNRKSHAQAYFGREQAEAKRCQSVAMQADAVERQVWGQIERWGEHPTEAIDLLATQMHAEGEQAETLRARVLEAQTKLDALQGERDTILREYRRGHMSQRDLDHQMDDLAGEDAKLRAQHQALVERVMASTETEARMTAARDLLVRLRAKLETALTLGERRVLPNGTAPRPASQAGLLALEVHYAVGVA